jgi:hypothetical protein
MTEWYPGLPIFRLAEDLADEDALRAAFAPAVVLIADSTGAADAAAAMQAAIDSLPNGGEIVIPAGTYLWSSAVPTLPRNLPRTLKITVTPGATIKLTSGAPRFLDFNKVADHDVFQNIWITGGGTIDCNNVGGKNHVILGTLRAGSYQTRIGFQDITIEHLTVINAPVDPTTTAHRLHVWLCPNHPASNEATQDKILRIRVADLKLYGGNAGVGIAPIVSDGGASANVYLDQITIERCLHTLLAPQTTIFASSNFHVGQSGFGGSVVIRDCVGLFAGDDAFEINGMDDVLLDNCAGQDALLEQFLIHNFRAPANPNKQRVVLRDCRADHVGLGATSSTPGRGYVIDGTIPISSVEMENCGYYRNGDAYQDTVAYDEALVVTAQMKRYVNNGFRVVIENYQNLNPAGATFFGQVCNISPANSPAIDVVLRDWKVSISGVRAAGATNHKIWRPIYFSPTGTTEMTLLVDGAALEYGQTNSSGAGTAIFISHNGGTARAVHRRVSVMSTTDNAALLAAIGSGVSASSRYRFDGCDTSKLTGSEFSINSAVQPQVSIYNHKWKTDPRAASGLTPSGSPYTYRNLDMTPEWVTVQGGTVSVIEYSVDGSIFWQVGVTQGVFMVQPAEYLRITYSVAPAVTKVFAR